MSIKLWIVVTIQALKKNKTKEEEAETLQRRKRTCVRYLNASTTGVIISLYASICIMVAKLVHKPTQIQHKICMAYYPFSKKYLVNNCAKHNHWISVR